MCGSRPSLSLPKKLRLVSQQACEDFTRYLRSLFDGRTNWHWVDLTPASLPAAIRHLPLEHCSLLLEGHEQQQGSDVLCVQPASSSLCFQEQAEMF